MLHFAEHSSSGRCKLPEVELIRVASQFSDCPFGRYRRESDHSGQVFRENWILPRLKAGKSIRIDIDDVEGLPSSFLEEVMGGLIREGYTVDELKPRLEWVTSQSELQFYKRLAWKYALEQERKQKAN